MKQFMIELHSFQEVQDFVEIATIQPFNVLVGNDRARVNAKSFMGMFSLDYSQSIPVRVDCSEEQCLEFQAKVAIFLA